MSGFLETVLAVCAALIAAELIGRLCPENSTVQFVGGLVALILLVSAVANLLNLDVDLSFSGTQMARQEEKLTSYVEERLEDAAQSDGEAYVEGLLAVAGLQAEKIQVLTDRNDDGSIVLTEVAVLFYYPSDGERAQVLLENALGGEVTVTVETEG